MTTKAVHLVVATDLTANSFLNVLKRFVSRRGLCSDIYSDNGGCFVGANNDLRSFLKALEQDNSFSTFCDTQGIRWHFNPANIPHMGGLWESAVKSAKYHLKRVIGLNCLSLEDFTTLCIQVEATVNSRPLIPLTDDPNDVCPLTPSHFLIGDVLKAIPQSNVQQIPVNRLSTYHALQQMYHHYWRRWSSEYVSTLQQRVKWKTASKELLNIGALALLKDKNSPPLYWALARIVKLHPGSDGITRVVTLRAKNGILKRAVSEICVLPIDV
ncbi:uncharacterized protein LOC130903109 [Diorhabda carinulata]|uniref:uncharacterized protein LOC130903109 n=1 Tax=Diorhabda carinulata TaxID=1163345 RepID=UPI0025A30B1F|nr:uncharacterized protein LOC130903109 [Diorhabda carinulata]